MSAPAPRAKVATPAARAPRPALPAAPAQFKVLQNRHAPGQMALLLRPGSGLR